jgi:argininosuccinate lyase
MKLWAGRVQNAPATLVNDFNSSIAFDARLYRQDIAGSIAHAAMLGRGIIDAQEAEKIVCRAAGHSGRYEDNKVEFSQENEDIHMNVSLWLTAASGIPEAPAHRPQPQRPGGGGFPALCQSRDCRHHRQILELERVLIKKAEANLDTVMPGYTHLQRAQPTTFAHHMMAYANMLRRDITRLEDCLERMDECPWGPALWQPPPIRWTDSRRPSSSASASLPTTLLDSVFSDRDFAIEISFGLFHPHDASVPLFRGDHPLVFLGIQICGSGRRLFHRFVHHGPRRRTRTWPSWCGQDGQGIRVAHRPAYRDEGAAAGLQQGYAGG